MESQSMFFSLFGSATINLSLGERPVRLPVETDRAPLAAITPSFRSTAKLSNSSTDKSTKIFDEFLDWTADIAYTP